MQILRTLILLSSIGLMGLSVQANHESKENHREFQKLYQSARQGDLEAQYRIGVILFHGLNGLNGSKDDVEALKWFREAAEAGHSGAQYYMGDIYQYGLAGTTPDQAHALEWYKRAASQGHMLAQTMVKRLTTAQSPSNDTSR